MNVNCDWEKKERKRHHISQENHGAEQQALRPVLVKLQNFKILKKKLGRHTGKKYQKRRSWICLKFKMQELREYNSMNSSSKQTKQTKTKCLMMNLPIKRLKKPYK